MIEDRNKSDMTKLVTAAAYRYLDERGFKPVETEVPICDGWIADLAGVINPTQTELQELKILTPKPRWKHPAHAQWCEDAKNAQKLMTCLVEVKTSMSDFRGDKKWTWLSKEFPVNLAYLAIPSALRVDRHQFPLNWGVLEYSESRDLVKCIQIPEVWEAPTEQQLSVVLNVAIRRDHHTRYERERGFRREMVANRNEDVSRTRVATAIRAVMAVVNGHSMSGRIPHASVQEALQYHGIKHVSGWDMEQLEKLWSKADCAKASSA